MHTSDAIENTMYIVTACFMLLASGAISFALHRTTEMATFHRASLRLTRIGLALEGLAMLLMALFGQIRLIHSVTRGMGIAASVIVVAGIVVRFRKARIARIPQ